MQVLQCIHDNSLKRPSICGVPIKCDTDILKVNPEKYRAVHKISTKNVTELCGVLVDIRYPPTEICRLTFEQCFYQLYIFLR